jgi:WD40 repeat protein
LKRLLSAIYFTADGRLLVTAYQDGTIKMLAPGLSGGWVCTKTFQTGRLSELGNRLNATSFAPQTHRLATCRDGKPVALWDVGEGTLAAQFHAPGVAIVALSPDGSRLVGGRATRDAHHFTVWNVRTREEVSTAPIDLIQSYALGFSLDGELLACGGQLGVDVYDTSTWQRRLFIRGDRVYSVAFSPDGRLLAFPSTQHGLVRLWNVAANREELVLKHAGVPHAVVFSPDGRVLLTADVHSVRIWDLAAASEKVTLAGHSLGVSGVVFSPDGKRLVSGSIDRTVKVWDAATGALLRTLPPFAEQLEVVAFRPDGRVLATGGYEGGLHLWDTRTWQPIGEIAHDVGGLWSAAFTSDGRHFAACGTKGVRLWRVAAPEGEKTDTPIALEKLGDRLSTAWVRHVAFSPDGQQLAWVEIKDNVLRLWDVANNRPLPAPPARLLGSTNAVAFLDAERIALVSAEGIPEVWNVVRGRRESAFDRGDLEARRRITLGNKISLSADNHWLACRGSHVTLWDVAAKKFLIALPEERVTVQSLALSPDRTRLAVGSYNGELVIWDIPKVRSQLATLGLDWAGESESEK